MKRRHDLTTRKLENAARYLELNETSKVYMKVDRIKSARDSFVFKSQIFCHILSILARNNWTHPIQDNNNNVQRYFPERSFCWPLYQCRGSLINWAMVGVNEKGRNRRSFHFQIYPQHVFIFLGSLSSDLIWCSTFLKTTGNDHIWL